ncbi:MarR family winged helix-turn-helix transcriptional regulator [Pseudokineococcus marinus]|uniref:Winged helix-turn-helix transcriptional regulator n=1 Tax=Pseudokineococcus marinus TaxID=351215 RepID=A0A849BGY7_9ACTN|nr:MarR family winged helix-turn-helix transcriptional regulator [Pseudokineococcus marinus]NNH21831.1 winged helix-turn-helix transcriptional regulator [Pseudokineococcus marinus]
MTEGEGSGRAGAPRGPDPLQVALREVLTLTSLARTVVARRLGLSVHDVEAMEHVMLSPEPLGPAGVSRRIGVTSAAATQSVQRLEAAGHMVRRPHPGDRRRQVLEVTETGAAHVMGALAPLLALTAGAADGMDERERAAVALYLARIADGYRTFVEDPPGPAVR